MTNHAPFTVTDYEVLFAARTGMTILLPKLSAFDQTPVTFRTHPDQPDTLLIEGGKSPVVLKNLKKPQIEAVLAKGFIMFYEMQGEDVVRNTLCTLNKA